MKREQQSNERPDGSGDPQQKRDQPIGTSDEQSNDQEDPVEMTDEHLEQASDVPADPDRPPAGPDRRPRADLVSRTIRNVEERAHTTVTRWSRWVSEDPGRLVEAIFSLLAVGIATWVILAVLDPGLLWRDTTPTGGDMGAHVWGPDYLKREVLPRFGFTGWTHDWFNGFPAYQFYMVVPSLFIVILSVGLHPLLAVAAVLVAVGAIGASRLHPRLQRHRRLVLVAAVALSVLAVPLTYNRSFKLVSVLGLVLLPLAAWAMAKLADLPFPIPPLTAVASLIFLFNREPLYLNHGNIIGGNFTSTLAGEFAFSISLTFAVLYLGVASRGLRTGRHRALAAVLFALSGLCHLIPAFFVLACTIALFLLHPDRARLRWMATMAPVGGLLTAFWVLPFWWRRDYVNDMGWERLPEAGAELSEAGQTMAGDQSSVWYYLFPPSGLRWIMIAALVGVAVSIIRRYRIGLVLALAWAGVAAAFVILPQYRLWNARLLPFQYLVVSLLAAIGIGELVRVAGIIASGRIERPYRFITVFVSSVFSIGVLVAVILPVNGLFESTNTAFGFERRDYPVSSPVVDADGEVTTPAQTERQARFKLFGRVIHAGTPDWSPVSSWARWNYTGLEDEESKAPRCESAEDGTQRCTGGWVEYRDLIATMTAVGNDPAHGCGRMLWEFEKDRVNSYGTTMAPMLLPYWTNGCIASQEGLYFESTPSVPFHFIVQSELSAGPSRPQRFVDWPDFDIDRGVQHLQMLGVRYYGAVTEEAITAADAHPDLELIAQSSDPDGNPAWYVYEVADAPDVSPLRYEPVVVEGIGESQDDWLPIASSWFRQGDLDVPFALTGPDGWQRVRAEPVPTEMRRLTDWLLDQVGRYTFLDELPEFDRRPLPEITVSDIERTPDRISFDVSEPGVPVLVKTSYFPNWTVSGAERVHRVAPNLMVVVPTDTHVDIRYRRSPIDLLAYALTLGGLVGLWWLTRQPAIEVSELGAGWLSDRIDETLRLDPRPEPAERSDGENEPFDGPNEADGAVAEPIEQSDARFDAPVDAPVDAPLDEPSVDEPMGEEP